MADLRLTVLAILVIAAGGCERKSGPQSSVTVKLPPARPRAAVPGFKASTIRTGPGVGADLGELRPRSR
jgi:hypothetical protein